jgi:hypothetical protein
MGQRASGLEETVRQRRLTVVYVGNYGKIPYEFAIHRVWGSSIDYPTSGRKEFVRLGGLREELRDDISRS